MLPPLKQAWFLPKTHFTWWWRFKFDYRKKSVVAEGARELPGLQKISVTDFNAGREHQHHKSHYVPPWILAANLKHLKQTITETTTTLSPFFQI